VASRRNDDGTVSFVTISPSEGGYEFIVTAAQTRGLWCFAMRSTSTCLAKRNKPDSGIETWLEKCLSDRAEASVSRVSLHGVQQFGEIRSVRRTVHPFHGH
jgi:hypothetical protein